MPLFYFDYYGLFAKTKRRNAFAARSAFGSSERANADF